MTPPRFFTDEDVFPVVAEQLCQAGLDAVSAQSVGRLGEADESQLLWAVAQSRVLVSFNVRDFARLHTEWIQHGREHAGLAVSAQVGIGAVVRRLRNLAASLSADNMRNRIEYLGSW